MSILSVASDKDLFKDPPPREDCPVCFIPMELWANGGSLYFHQNIFYLPCCGKMMCVGCFDRVLKEIKLRTLKNKCILCNTPIPREWYKTRSIEKIDARVLKNALSTSPHPRVLGYTPTPGYPKTNKELELLERGAKAGSIDASYYVGPSG